MVLDKIIELLADLLDLELDEITANSYIMRDLEAESIDLLEIGVSMHAEFGIRVRDHELFLRDLRIHLDEIGENRIYSLSKIYPHLTISRLNEMLEDLPNGPVMKVEDIVSYVEYQQGKRVDE